MLTILLLVFIFGMGLYWYSRRKIYMMEYEMGDTCGSMLVKKDGKFYLYKKGANQNTPIEFHSLDEYIEFLKWQQRNGIHCPVLYAQEMTNAQGEEVYAIHPSVSEPQYGLPVVQA